MGTLNIYDYAGSPINKTYNKNGGILTKCYDLQGNPIGEGHVVSDNVTKSLLMTPNLPTGTQGLACDSITQSIAQLYTEQIYMVTVSDGSFSSVGQINLGHGHTGQFAPTKASGQAYPLLYVCGPGKTIDDNPYCYMLEIECGLSSSQLKKIYAIPAVSGFTGTLLTCVDFDNGIVYLVSASTYSGTADYTYISAWDMNTSELFDGATYSPTPQEGIYKLTRKLFEFQVPFIPEMQACTFFDGLIVAISDRSYAENKFYQFIDVDTQDVYLTLNKVSLMLSGELEGVGFLYNNETNKYDMIVSTRLYEGSTYHTDYYRYEFN